MGSACLFFAARPKSAILGDRNHELISFYRALRRRPRDVWEVANAWSQDRDAYYDVRALRPSSLSAVDSAARFLYLNRFCFNGLYRTDRHGNFNVPFGTATGALPSLEKVRLCAYWLRKAQLMDGDFEETLDEARSADVVYLDPPYTRVPSHAYGVYGYGSFDSSDLDRMMAALERLDDRGVRFLFSYANVPAVIASSRKKWSIEAIEGRNQIAGNAAKRGVRGEVLITNFLDR